MAVGIGRRRWARRALGGVLVAAAVVLSGCVAPPPEVRTPLLVFPAAAIDPEISLGPGAINIAGRPLTEQNGRLVVLLHGSGSNGPSLGQMARNLVDAGHHVISPTYDAVLGTLDACPNSVRTTMPDCHRQFRGEVTFGEGAPAPQGPAADHPDVHVPLANSVMNSILKQVEYLHREYPLDGWAQYIDQVDGECAAWSDTYGACGLRWDRVTLLGYSQGGGVALYMGKEIRLARVGMISAPFDVFGPPSDPLVAPWITEGGFATPAADIAQLTHELEANRWRQLAVAGALELPGPPVLISSSVATYGGSNQLVSDLRPTCTPITSSSYHLAPAGGSCTSEPDYQGAWRFLASGN